MTDASAKKIEALHDARNKRSALRRAAVEDAMHQLSDSDQAVTFVSVARLANVSRQYLYNNFADEIGVERDESKRKFLPTFC